MFDGLDMFLKLGVMVLTAGAVYGAIKSDLRAMHEKIATIEKDTDNANKRIDDILMKGRRNNDLHS